MCLNAAFLYYWTAYARRRGQTFKCFPLPIQKWPSAPAKHQGYVARTSAASGPSVNTFHPLKLQKKTPSKSAETNSAALTDVFLSPRTVTYSTNPRQKYFKKPPMKQLWVKDGNYCIKKHLKFKFNPFTNVSTFFCGTKRWQEKVDLVAIQASYVFIYIPSYCANSYFSGNFTPTGSHTYSRDQTWLQEKNKYHRTIGFRSWLLLFLTMMTKGGNKSRTGMKSDSMVAVKGTYCENMQHLVPDASWHSALSPWLLREF